MIEKIRLNQIRILIIFSVFVIYFCNGTGVLDISLRSGISPDMNGLRSVFAGLLFRMSSIQALSLWWMLLSGLALSVMLPVLPPWKAAGVALASALPQWLFSSMAPSGGLILPIEYSLLIVMILFLVNALIGYFIETQSRQKLLHVFGQYVPPQLVEQISRQPAALDMTGEARRLTVCFCDLQDFSNVAEQLNPKQLTLLLNEYFDCMTEIIYRHGGTIDKYIGDAIMAFWGAPLVQADHAERSVRAALEMQKGIRELSNRFIKKGWPGPKMGTGINTGMMNVGNMGSKYRVAYTVIGDAVNLAARVEALTRSYGVPILVSEATKHESGNIVFRQIDTVQVKGKHNTAKLFQPLCLQSEMNEEMARRLVLHQKAIDCYEARDYAGAAKIFRGLRDLDRNDALYPAMLKLLTSRGESGNLSS